MSPGAGAGAGAEAAVAPGRAAGAPVSQTVMFSKPGSRPREGVHSRVLNWSSEMKSCLMQARVRGRGSRCWWYL